METFKEYLNTIESPQQRIRVEEISTWILHRFPNLSQRIAWNQPMFTDHDTFIIGFSLSKKHLAISPESAGMIQFCDEIAHSGYEQSKMLFRIKWDNEIDFSLLERIIEFNILDKKNCTTFWRK